MMIEGRLRWSQSTTFDGTRRRADGSWYVWSIDDQLCYHARRDNGGWSASATGRGEPIDLGWHIYLKDAKRAVDAHHHAHILAGDNWGHKSYIQRYPLTCVAAQ